MATFAFGSWNAGGNGRTELISAEAVEPLLWSSEQVHLATLALAKQAGWVDPQQSTTPTSAESLTTIAQQWKVNVDPINVPYSEIDYFSRHSDMILVSAQANGTSGWLAIVKCNRRHCVLLKPGGSVEKISRSLLKFALRHQLEIDVEGDIQQTLSAVEIDPVQHQSLRQAFLDQQLAETKIALCWQLSQSAGASWWSRIQERGLPRLFGASAGFQLALIVLSYTITLLVGTATFTNSIEWGWIALICIMLVLQLPLELSRQWTTAIYNLLLVLLIKQRMIYGILRLTPQETREFGTGQFLAWGLEGLALNTVGMVVMNLLRSLFALTIIVIVLTALGAPLIIAVLFIWALMAVGGGYGLYRLRYNFESYHAIMINGVMERMQGHQTRLMQEDNWYGADDAAMTHFFDLKRRVDRAEAFFVEWMPYAWLLGALSVLAHNFIQAPDQLVAIGFAVILFTKIETATLAKSLASIAEGFTAWQLIAPIEKGARRPVYDGKTNADVLRPATPVPGQQLAIVQNIAFRYPGSETPIIRQANLKINIGDRMLLEGPSGGGKSTLAYLMSGHYSPEKGLLFLWGLDKHTLGSVRWRKWVVYVPQFHQNHIISASLAFNLLMGREWPPQPQDLVDAEAVCRELGLGRLLERMPQGLDQRVGERGWHLSHGERSRIYIARALLQQADLIVLDESFASLDPENMAIALRTVLKRARTLMVIAHP